MTSWRQIEQQRRWMPVGRPDDPKAPAPGWQSDRPHNWMRFSDVRTALAGLNFGWADGLIGVDLDFKPGLAGSEQDLERAKRLLGHIRAGLSDAGLPVELSYSGKGLHYFGWADDDLMQAFRDRELTRFKHTLVPAPPPEGKDVAGLEVYGGGNSYLSVTGRWVVAPAELPIISLSLLDSLFPAGWRDATQTWGQSAAASRRHDDTPVQLIVDEIADGLRAKGYPVQRAKNNGWQTQTVCHGGDSKRGLVIQAGDFSPLLTCFSDGCAKGDGHRDALVRVCEAAGVSWRPPEPRRDSGSGGGDAVRDAVDGRRVARPEGGFQRLVVNMPSAASKVLSAAETGHKGDAVEDGEELTLDAAREIFGSTNAAQPWCARCAKDGVYHRIGAQDGDSSDGCTR